MSKRSLIVLGFYFESSSREVLRFLLGSFRELLPEGSVISTAFPVFPPHQVQKFHNQVISEILEERVKQRKERSNPRGVKRKGSSYRVVKSLGKTHVDYHFYSIGRA